MSHSRHRLCRGECSLSMSDETVNLVNFARSAKPRAKNPRRISTAHANTYFVAAALPALTAVAFGGGLASVAGRLFIHSNPSITHRASSM
jgi:hypothetical protein